MPSFNRRPQSRHVSVSRRLGYSSRKSLWPPVLCLVLLLAAPELGRAGALMDTVIAELVWLNCSGRAVESFERVGTLISEQPDNYAAYMLRANCYGWFIARNPDNRMYDNPLLESLDACVKNAERIDEDSPRYGHALFYRAMGKVLRARFRAMRGYDLTSRWATRGAKDAADELVDMFPDDINARLPRAIFEATWGGNSIWQRVALFTLTIPRGDRERGIETLEQITDQNGDSRLWAMLVLIDIYMSDPSTAQQYLETAEKLHTLFPDNSVVQLELADSYRGLERWVLAEAVYRSILAKVNSRIPSYDEVVFEISRLRMVECQVELEKMDEAFKVVREILISNPINPEWVVPWAHYWTARIYVYRDEPLRARRALEYARDGKDFNKLHQQADRLMDRVKKIIEEQEKR
ncbi:tetratricopeptide repeat protein [Gemmatimonadota bacterium]